MSGIRRLIQWARRKRVTPVAVLSLTACYNAAAVAVAHVGKRHPLLTAVLMPLSQLVTLGLVVWLLGREPERDASVRPEAP